MDGAGRIYVVNETGSATAHAAAVGLRALDDAQPGADRGRADQPGGFGAGRAANRVKVADVTVTDDGIGTNALSASGARVFEVDATGLYLKAGKRRPAATRRPWPWTTSRSAPRPTRPVRR